MPRRKITSAQRRGERWKTIPSFPDYQVSTLGAVRRRGDIKAGRRHRYKDTSKPSHRTKKGVRVWLIPQGMPTYTCNSVQRYVHDLVLETFVGPCPEGMIAKFSDGNRHNCALSNIAWGLPDEHFISDVDKRTILRTVTEACEQDRWFTKRQLAEELAQDLAHMTLKKIGTDIKSLVEEGLLYTFEDKDAPKRSHGFLSLTKQGRDFLDNVHQVEPKRPRSLAVQRRIVELVSASDERLIKSAFVSKYVNEFELDTLALGRALKDTVEDGLLSLEQHESLHPNCHGYLVPTPSGLALLSSNGET